MLAGLVALSGCDLFGSSNGTLRLKLTDAPFPYDLVEEANVTISRVDIVGDTTGSEDVVFTVSEEEREFNLLTLQDGVTALLGEIDLPAGRYSQVRLIVSDASIVLNDEDATTYPLFIPSGAQTGIKVLLPHFEIEEGVVSELTLDFLVDESFIVQGDPSTHAGISGFIFSPVVKPLGLADVEEEEVTETTE